MKAYKFSQVCMGVLGISVLYTIVFGSKDYSGTFITAFGAFVSCATMMVAFYFFKNYSATADLQKKQFDYVVDLLTMYVSKSFLIETDKITYFGELTKSRLEYLAPEILKNPDALNSSIISIEFFQFLADFCSKMSSFLCPNELKIEILGLLPSSLTIVKIEDKKDKMIFKLSGNSTEYGIPTWNFDKQYDSFDMLKKLVDVKYVMQNYLNNKLHDGNKIEI